MLAGTASPREVLNAMIQHQEQQVQIAAELEDRYQVEILVINLMLLDQANHKMPNMEQVEQSICKSDSDLNYLLQTFKPDNVMLFSDHGSRRVRGTFLLHAWLRDQGYCVQVRHTPSERLDALNWLLAQWLQDRWQGSNGNNKVLRRALREILQ